MHIFVYDHLGSTGTPRLSGLPALINAHNATYVGSPLDLARDEWIDTEWIAFVHADDEVGCEHEDWEAAANPNLCKYVVFVSSHPLAVLTNAAGCYACRREFSEVVTSGDYQHVVDALQNGGDPIRWLQRFDASAPDAAIILCEAWLLSQGEPLNVCNGITVHAPVKPKDWFEPFGKTVTRQSAEEIAELLRGAETEAKILFLRMLDFGGPEDALPPARFLNLIESLLGKLRAG